MNALDDRNKAAQVSLSKELLASVSRSFSLSLRALPAAVRPALELGYLLARASDTLADTVGVPVSGRAACLEEYCGVLFEGGASDCLTGMIEEAFLPRQSHAGERELLRRLPECLLWLDRRPPREQDELRAVLKEITRGQLEDCVRGGEPGRVVWLESAEELDRYTYLVAGSVGRFWTRIADLHLSGWRSQSVLPDEEMTACGIRFGKALQLVNILRDLPADLRAGRGYLPRNEVREAGGWGERAMDGIPEGNAMTSVARRWERRAQEWLEDGRRYAGALRSRRMRLATVLPLRLGEETLALLSRAGWEERAKGIKISRRRVRRILAVETVRSFATVWRG
ncbi:MAG TPA: squalene/phytoene synthase family protein [Verrucomicrobiales bacterium]|nr:squalene/phytoene synthase family protein [Verrucomicrobiales bacterium]